MKISLSLMWRMLVRDWRAGELTVVTTALIIATAALTGVSFLTDRIEQALTLESHQLLGGDLMLSADHPWPDHVVEQSRIEQLQLARSTGFISMVSANGTAQLADVKAVSANYPLRGRLRTAPALNQADAESQGGPAPGSVWLDERLTSALGVAPGGMVRVGSRDFIFAAVLTLEPDRGLNVFALAPRLMLNDQDLPSTGLIQEGSRVTYRLHLAGDPAAVARFQAWMELHLGRGERLETLDNARPEIRNVLERSQRFLRLGALLAVVLSAVALALSADRYVRRHLDGCAVLRCLGAGGMQLVAIHGGEFLLLGAIVTVAGCLLGDAVQYGLQHLLSGIVRGDLPQAGWAPWLQGAAINATLVAGFALPPLLRLRQVSTLRVLRREWGNLEPVSLSAWASGAAMLALLMLWVAGDVQLWLTVLGGFAAAIVLFAGAAGLALAGLGRLRRRGGTGWRQGIANLRRRPRASAIQIVALGLALTALLLLTVARGDLLDAWQGRVPPDAPNRFAINIQPEQVVPLAGFFAAHHLAEPVMEPMVRGRLVAINGRAVEPKFYSEEKAQRLVDREFNLSRTGRLPEGNTVTAGLWHGADRAPQFSVEQGLAETLGLKLGDELSFDVAGNRLSARITSLRKLDWDSMRVNFFVIASNGLLEAFPTSYLTAFHLPQGQLGFIDELVRSYPNVTVIDVEAVMRQLRDTISQVARLVQAVFGFALLAGLAVLYAALQATADERAHEIALLRALGARQNQLRAALVAEFALLGATAGLLAGTGASLISMALARWVFHLPYSFDPWLLAWGMSGGVAMALGAGMLGSRGAMRGSPMEALRAI